MKLHQPREMCNIGIPPSGRITKIKENLNDSSVWKVTAKLDLFLFALQTYELDHKHFDTQQQEGSDNDSSTSLARPSSC